MSADLHPAYRQALNAEIPDPDLGAFLQSLEALIHRAVKSQQAWGVGPAELKQLVRARCRRYAETTGKEAFTDGSYFPLFIEIYASNSADRRLLLLALEELHRLSEGLDDPVSAAAATSSRVLRIWSVLAGQDTILDPTPATQLMLWRVFESLVKGEIEIASTRWGDRVRHYPRFATAKKLVQRRSDPRRAEVLANLKFTLGCTSLRRPPLVKLLARDERLSDKHRKILMAAVRSRDTATAEPISILLRHHVELVALAGYDRVDVLSDLITDFVTHLRGDVLVVGQAPDNAAMIEYLRVLQERYLPGLFNYARILREARLGSPFLGDMLHESYLVRTRSFDGDQEPSFAQLLQDWVAAQRVIQTRAGYKSIKGFSFAQAYLEEAPPGESDPGDSGQTRHGFPVKELDEFQTILKLPPIPAEGAAAADEFSGGEEVDDASETRPYRPVQRVDPPRVPTVEVPTTEVPIISSPPELGPRVLSVRLSNMDDLYSSPTEILPIFTDDAVDLHAAVTEIIPTTAEGAVDLRRVASTLLPTPPDKVHQDEN